MSAISRRLLGRIAYDAYGNTREWTAVGGNPMPRWDDQAAELQQAWMAAAAAVRDATTENAEDTRDGRLVTPAGMEPLDGL